MKRLLFVALFALSSISFAAEVKNCDIEGKIIENAVVPSAVTVATIEKTLKSDLSEVEKRKIIKSFFFIDGASIGDGTSFCELVKVDQDKCLKTLTSSDIIDAIVDEENAGEDLACVIGVSTMLFLAFF